MTDEMIPLPFLPDDSAKAARKFLWKLRDIHSKSEHFYSTAILDLDINGKNDDEIVSFMRSVGWQYDGTHWILMNPDVFIKWKRNK